MWTRPLASGVAAALALAGAATVLAGCGSSGPAPGGRLPVVAAEDVWGDVAAQLGGDQVAVTSLITNPNADPHEYTADAAAALAVHAARLVIVNGATYDTFMGQLLSASGSSPRVLTVAAIVHASGPDPNPHFWYDLASVRLVAAAVARSYVALDPRGRAGFEARLRAFDASLAPIQAVIDAIARRDAGAPVAYTERVPGYLVEAAGLDDRTPSGIARSIEQGTDPSLADTVAMQHLVASRQVRALLYNVQAVTPVTEQVRQLATAAHVPVVDVTETLPTADRTYQRWQLSQDDALLAALAR